MADGTECNNELPAKAKKCSIWEIVSHSLSFASMGVSETKISLFGNTFAAKVPRASRVIVHSNLSFSFG